VLYFLNPIFFLNQLISIITKEEENYFRNGCRIGGDWFATRLNVKYAAGHAFVEFFKTLSVRFFSTPMDKRYEARSKFVYSNSRVAQLFLVG
jgi:hypothetical protein